MFCLAYRQLLFLSVARLHGSNPIGVMLQNIPLIDTTCGEPPESDNNQFSLEILSWLKWCKSQSCQQELRTKHRVPISEQGYPGTWQVSGMNYVLAGSILTWLNKSPITSMLKAHNSTANKLHQQIQDINIIMSPMFHHVSSYTTVMASKFMPMLCPHSYS